MKWVGHLAALKAAFSLAVRNAKVDRHPVSLVRMQKENNCPVRGLTDGEEARLFVALPPAYHPLVLMALYDAWGPSWSKLVQVGVSP